MKKTGISLTYTLDFYIFENQETKYQHKMKTIFMGIITLLIPVFLFAQTAKETQDLNQVQKKISKLENENARLRNQLNGVQKSFAKMNEAEAKEHLDLAKHDSVARAAQDTVKAYSVRLLKNEKDIEENERALMLRGIGFLVILILLIVVIAVLSWVHLGTHRKRMSEVMEKMHAQREEREKRIAEVRSLIEQSGNELAAVKKETGERLTALADNISHVDKNLQTLLTTKSNELDHQIKDGLGRIRKDHEDVSKDLVKKLEEVRAQLASKFTELGQKVADSGKKLDDQITAAHKKTDELKTILAKEIEAIRSKFE